MVDKFWITTELNGKVIGEFRRPITDPFISHTVHVRWQDVIKGLLMGRKYVDITITVGCSNQELMDKVIELSNRMDDLENPDVEN